MVLILLTAEEIASFSQLGPKKMIYGDWSGLARSGFDSSNLNLNSSGRLSADEAAIIIEISEVQQCHNKHHPAQALMGVFGMCWCHRIPSLFASSNTIIPFHGYAVFTAAFIGNTP